MVQVENGRAGILAGAGWNDWLKRMKTSRAKLQITAMGMVQASSIVTTGLGELASPQQGLECSLKLQEVVLSWQFNTS